MRSAEALHHAILRAAVLAVVAMVCACSPSQEGRGFDGSVDRYLDPDKSGAQWAWQHINDVRPEMVRYAFYPDAGAAYTAMTLRAQPAIMFDGARSANEELGLIFADTQLAIYMLPTGEYVEGSEWEAYQRRRRRTLQGQPADPPREGSDAATEDPNADPPAALPIPLEGRTAAAEDPEGLPDPRQRLGTLALFGSPGRTLTLEVYRDPASNRWYFIIDGAKGDRAYYEIGRDAAIRLAGAQRTIHGGGSLH